MAVGIQFIVGRLKGESTTTVQSVLFDREKWDAGTASTWLKDHNFHAAKLDQTENRLRYRQREPGDFQDGSLRTIDAGSRKMAIEDYDQHYAQGTTYELNNVEIFAIGKWKGENYTAADLDAMVDAFDKVGYRPPIKLGHTDAVGAPAMGWIKSIRRVGQKLVADFMDLPEKVYQAIKDHQYDTVSSEIYWNVKRGTQTFRRALKAVALLGAEIPAVAGLAPLRNAFGFHDTDTHYELHVHQLTTEDIDMPGTDDKNQEKLQQEIEKQKEQIEKLTADLEKAQAKGKDKDNEEIQELTATVKQLQADLKTSKEHSDKLEADRKKDKRDSLVNSLKIPALRPHLAAFVELAQDAGTEKTYTVGEGDKAEKLSALDLASQMIDTINKDAAKLFTEVSKATDNSKEGDDIESGTDAGVQLDKFARELMAKDEKLEYLAALQQAQKEHPDLAKAYSEIDGTTH